MSNFFGYLLKEKDTEVHEKEREKESDEDIQTRIDISFQAITDNQDDRINFSQMHLLISQGIGIGIELSNLTKCCEKVIRKDLKMHSVREWRSLGRVVPAPQENDRSGRNDQSKKMNVERSGGVKTNGDSTNADVAASSVGRSFNAAGTSASVVFDPDIEMDNTLNDEEAAAKEKFLRHSTQVISNTTGSNLIGIQSDEKLFTLTQVSCVVKELLANENATNTASFSAGLIIPLTLLFPLLFLLASCCCHKKSQNLIDNIFATWSLPKRAWKGIKAPFFFVISTVFWGVAFWNGMSLFHLDDFEMDPGK